MATAKLSRRSAPEVGVVVLRYLLRQTKTHGYSYVFFLYALARCLRSVLMISGYDILRKCSPEMLFDDLIRAALAKNMPHYQDDKVHSHDGDQLKG